MGPMTILKFIILLILGTATGTGIGFLVAKVLLKRLIGEYKPSFSQKLAQAINERLTSFDRESAAEFTEKSAARIRAWVQTWYRQHSSNTMPLREALERAISAEAVDQIAEGARKQLTAIILDELEQHDSGTALSHFVIERVRQTVMLPGLISNALAALEAPMASVINHTINEYAPGLLDREIGNMEARLLDMRLCDLAEKSSSGVDRTLDMLTQLCVVFCNDHMEDMLQSVDLGKVIAHGIETVADEQLNVLWKDLAAKEQKLLVVLASIVGFISSVVALIGMLL